MTSPELQLSTAYVLNERGRIISTREPGGTSNALFVLVKGATSCVWAVGAEVPEELAGELTWWAEREGPSEAFAQAPSHAARYREILQRLPSLQPEPDTLLRCFHGPAFSFPHELSETADIADTADIVMIEDERALAQYFDGWVEGEIRDGREPVMAILHEGDPVSICCCARRSNRAAEAGLETAAAFRGRGFAARVTVAWARAVMHSGRTPLYSTDWTNQASLGVARKMRLITYASIWSLSKQPRR